MFLHVSTVCSVLLLTSKEHRVLLSDLEIHTVEFCYFHLIFYLNITTEGIFVRGGMSGIH